MHVFAHSHTDLGWLSTVEDYFNGNRLDFYIGSVKQMFDTVKTSLEKDPRRKFNYAEMKFFKMWWQDLSDQQKVETKKLLENGQWSILNGGLSAPDEAVTNADDILDNFMAGHRFLRDDVGLSESHLPKTSW